MLLKKIKFTFLYSLVLLSVGACGGGGSSFSGSGGAELNEQERQHQTAKDILEAVNPVSISVNREYGGFIYRDNQGRFIATEPIVGGSGGVRLDPPPNLDITAIYHTHAREHNGTPGNEAFSSGDIGRYNRDNIDGYLATPQGRFVYYDVSSKTSIVLGDIAN